MDVNSMNVGVTGVTEVIEVIETLRLKDVLKLVTSKLKVDDGNDSNVSTNLKDMNPYVKNALTNIIRIQGYNGNVDVTSILYDKNVVDKVIGEMLKMK